MGDISEVQKYRGLVNEIGDELEKNYCEWDSYLKKGVKRRERIPDDAYKKISDSVRTAKKWLKSTRESGQRLDDMLQGKTSIPSAPLLEMMWEVLERSTTFCLKRFQWLEEVRNNNWDLKCRDQKNGSHLDLKSSTNVPAPCVRKD